MPEDFSKVYTIEVFTSKEVWEVVATYDYFERADERFRIELLTTPLKPVRLTTPMDVSIYD